MCPVQTNGVTTNYLYDGEGRRVEKTTGAAATVCVYDATANEVAQYSTQAQVVGGTEYVTADHLGSTRLVTNAGGTPVACHDYLPFREELLAPESGRTGCYASVDGVTQKFTGKERDTETAGSATPSGLDYFGARYMNSAQGRFTSPDLVNVTNDRLLNPSNTLNKYVYGGNNPLKYTDPDGRDITIFYETGFPTGHVMMAATNQETNDFAFMSVGPQTHHDPNILSNPIEGVPGTSEFNLPRSVDELRNNFAALTIQTTPEVAQQAIDAIRAGAGTGNWAMLGNNCTSACATVLKDLGLSPGSKGFLPWTPSRFWANLYFKYGKSKQPAWLRWTVQATSLIQRPVTTGYDYGNSRYGMNTFDFIMLQLNAPQKACVTTPGLNGGPPEKVCQ